MDEATQGCSIGSVTKSRISKLLESLSLLEFSLILGGSLWALEKRHKTEKSLIIGDSLRRRSELVGEAVRSNIIKFASKFGTFGILCEGPAASSSPSISDGCSSLYPLSAEF